MDRTADYTIQGFMYQFNKMLLEVLSSEHGEEIAIEGPIEDVEVVGTTGTKAIQCKYHEAKEGFSLSAIYKPLLQMMQHYEANKDLEISYVLFAHFPGEAGTKALAESDLADAIGTKNKALQKYCVPLKDFKGHAEFLKKFKLEFGGSYEDLVVQVKAALLKAGFIAADIEVLAYPNAFHLIALLSIEHDISIRKTTRAKLVSELKRIKTTAISKWTLSLQTKKQLLLARRNQLKDHLGKNQRQRHLLLTAEVLSSPQAEIVEFLKDFVEKYYFKPSHAHPPLFCLETSSETFKAINLALYSKGVKTEDGYISDEFKEDKFFRRPMEADRGRQKEFQVRIAHWGSNGDVLTKRKPDDVYILGSCDHIQLAGSDYLKEAISTNSIKEIAYIMGVSNTYE